MKYSIALFAAAAAVSTTSITAFAPTSISRSAGSALRVSKDISTSKTAIDLDADFDSVSPEDVVSEGTKGGAKVGQAEVVLVGCGAPNRGMGWYHAIQMLEGR